MLRPRLYPGKRLGLELVRCRQRSQWLIPRPEATARVWQRSYVDARTDPGPTKSTIKDSQPVVLPGSASTTTSESPPPAPGSLKVLSPDSLSSSMPSTTATPTSTPTIALENIPLAPPAPPADNVPNTTSTGKPDPPATSKKSVVVPPPLPPSPPPSSAADLTPPKGSPLPPSPPPPARKPRRLRRFFLTLFLLTGLGYGLGTYFSLVNDTFHEYFTEYVPYGEDAVIYFEELRFRRRFPNAGNRLLSTPRQASKTVTIPSGSGISWRVAEDEDKSSTDSTKTDTRDSAGSEHVTSKADPGDARQHPGEATKVDKVAAVKEVKHEVSSPAPKQSEADDKPETEHEPAAVQPVQKEELRFEEPEPAPPIELVAIAATDDPVIQDIAKIFNNIIKIINADQVSARYSSVVEAARSELSKLASKISEAREKVVEEKLSATHREFDQAAKELVRRLEDEMRDQEARWQDEFEFARAKIQQAYEEKLQTELSRAQEIHEQRLHNELLEQAVQLKRQFIAEVAERVESERNGRLGKLSELSGNLKDLEKLSTGWRDVVDSNLKTQQLHVAVEAVRANLESTTAQPRPFVRELAALKEIAADDPVVNAAIASLNPVGYQRGLPSTAQLIDRFRRVAAEVRKASLVPEHAGAASHAASVLLSKLLFRKQGIAMGDDVESVLARAETFLEEGNLDQAAREMNGLTGWAKTLSGDWLAEVRKVLEVQQALDVIATEARLQSLLVEEG
ncbi:MAG: Formation of crista junctions protein 1 [Peltula sp. TS41687]|nr:MAG: Formation of crista junctions protein 1 [Peltula sp. TS41687]